MADNPTIDNGALPDYPVSADEGAGGYIQRMKLCYAADGDETHIPADANGLKVNIGNAGEVALSAATLAALESITVVDGGGSLTVDGTFWQATQPVSGPLTDAQLRAAVVPVSDGGGSLTVDGTVGVSGTVTSDTELPAAAALSDTTANPTAPMVGAGAMLWDAGTSQWKRAPGDVANGLDVDVTRLPALVAGAAEIGGVNQTKVAGTAVSVNSGVKDAGTQRVILASDQTVVPVSDNGGSLTVDGTFFQATQPVSLATNTPDVTDRDARLLGRAKILDSTGAVIDPTTKAQLPGALAAGGGLKVEGVAGGVAQPVSGTVTANAGTGPFPVSDNAGSLTVDAPVGTPVFVRLSDGSAAIATLPVDVTDRAARLLGHVIVDAGDVDHDAVNTAKVQQVGGHASPVDVPPTVVSTAGDRARLWVDRYGATVMRRRKIRETYTAVFRLAEAAARLDQTFTQVANTTKQWATLHHTGAATKEVRLQKCVVWITGWTVAVMQAVLELRQISAAPATGNPAITPTPRRRGGTAAEAIALYLPTTAGTEANANSPLAHVAFDYGIMGGVSVVNPLAGQQFGPGSLVLYDASQEDDEALAPTLPVATLDGWAVCLRSVGAPVVRLTCMMVFTEEIP